MSKRHILLAAALGLAGYLLGRRSKVAPVSADDRARARDWYTDAQPGPDGRLSQDALADKASADSFPASDPPAAMTSIIPGAPAR